MIGKNRDMNRLIFMLFLLFTHKNSKKSKPCQIKEMRKVYLTIGKEDNT